MSHGPFRMAAPGRAMRPTPGSPAQSQTPQFANFATTVSDFLIVAAAFGYNEQRERRRWARPSRAISVAAIHGLLDASGVSAALAWQLNKRVAGNKRGSSWISCFQRDIRSGPGTSERAFQSPSSLCVASPPSSVTLGGSFNLSRTVVAKVAPTCKVMQVPLLGGVAGSSRLDLPWSLDCRTDR